MAKKKGPPPHTFEQVWAGVQPIMKEGRAGELMRSSLRSFMDSPDYWAATSPVMLRVAALDATVHQLRKEGSDDPRAVKKPDAD